MSKSKLIKLHKAALDAGGASRLANKMLYAEAKTWKKDDMDAFFEAKLRKATERHFQNTAIYPNAEELIQKNDGRRGVLRWRKNVNNYKFYLLSLTIGGTKRKPLRVVQDSGTHGLMTRPGAEPDMPEGADDDQLEDILTNLYTRYGDRVDKLLPAARRKAERAARA